MAAQQATPPVVLESPGTGIPSNQVAARYMRALFEHRDTVCIHLIHSTETYVGSDGQLHARTQTFFQTLEQATDEAAISKLEKFNLEGWHVYVAMNAYKEQAGKAHRTKQMVEAIRTAYVDIDDDGDEQINAVELDVIMGALPEPHFTLQSSPGKYQSIWLVKDMAQREQEGLNKALQLKYGGDPQAVDSTTNPSPAGIREL